MKIIKPVIAVLTAVLMLLSVGLPAFAEEEGYGYSSSILTPHLVAEGFSADKAVYNGTAFNLTFKLKNTSSDVDVRNVLIRLSGGEAFAVNGGTDTVYADRIAKGGTASFSKAFVCADNAPAGMNAISASVSYEYFEGEEKFSASEEFTFSVKVNQLETSAPSNNQNLTPQLLISKFSFGGAEVNGGEVFSLSFTVKNNSSSIKVQNVIVKLSGGEAFVVADGTDTVSVDSIGAKGAATITKAFKCQNNIPSGIYPISASISYEYFDGGEKASGSADLVMSIPTAQPDRVSFEGITLADQKVTQGQENDCGFQIINSGQTRLSNCKVVLVDDNNTVIASAYIGNIEAGTQFSSNYTLPVTFNSLGEKQVVLVLEYENEDGEKKSTQTDFKLTVEEEFNPFEDIENGEDDIVTPTASPIKVAVISIVALLGTVAAIIIIVKVVKKKKAGKGSVIDEEI